MKHALLTLLSCFFLTQAFSQEERSRVVGQIRAANNEPIAEAEVSIQQLKLLTVTDAAGQFVFSEVPYGQYDFVVSDGLNQETFRFVIDQPEADLGEIDVSFLALAHVQAEQPPLPVVFLEESSASPDDESMSSHSVSAVLTASRDPFLSVAAYTFGSMRYLIRGYKRNELEVTINGLTMNDLESGAAYFGQWGGLNDVFRNQTTSFGIAPSDFSFGGLMGSTYIDATASSQRAQTRISYSRANASYRNRVMVTHSTGLMKNGWAFSASVSKRWANEGYIPGTSYDGHAYYLGISKKLSEKSMLHLTTFGAPTLRGKAMPTIKEAMELAGSHYYNPNWGYQNGKKRNARMNHTYQPAVLLNYEYKPNTTTILNLAASFQTGYNGNSALDWYNAQDPRPDYYRNLPSYHIFNPAGPNHETAEAVRQEWLKNPAIAQVNWDRLYEANRLNFETVNGVSGKRSLYVVGEDRDDITKYNFAALLQKKVSPELTLNFGANAIYQQTESYRKMLDLLGGDFYVNLNQFAERTYVGNSEFNQNDLNHPNQIIREGDRYQYNYIARFSKAFVWGQGVWTLDQFDFFAAVRGGLDAFGREGLYKNGLFQNDSYGKSDLKSFLTYDVKAGATYKIDGRNYVYLSTGYFTTAPEFDHTFFSPRTRNASIANNVVQKTTTIEGGYLLNAPSLRGRLSGFLSDSKDGTRVLRYYHESYRTFVNYAMQNVNIRNLGLEFAVQAKISPSLSATLVASWMEVFYTSRPKIDIYKDNDTSTAVGNNTVYWKNYYVASGPQSAYSLGLNYNSPKYWFANLNASFLNRSYLDVNPSRLTEEAVGLTPVGSAERNRILEQEELPGMFTLDLFAGKSFALNKIVKSIPRGTMLFLTLGVNNILNNKNMITGGFQQLRFDYATRDPERFPSKYFYGYGTTYFFNMSLRF